MEAQLQQYQRSLSLQQQRFNSSGLPPADITSPQGCSDLLQGQLIDVVQHGSRLGLLVKVAEELPDELAALERRVAASARDDVELGLLGHSLGHLLVPSGALGPEQVQAVARGDGDEPGERARVTAKLVQVPHRPHKDLLRGVLGLGLMHGRQKHFYLPESHTDFIYAVIGEELGLWGATAILFGYFIIIWRGIRIFLLTPDDFGRMLALGLTIVAFNLFGDGLRDRLGEG